MVEVNELLAPARPRMEAALLHFQNELKTIRTGRASVQMIEPVMVPYYGTPTPIKQLATLTTPDATQILIQPFDPGVIKEIAQAIREAGLGFNPSDDGRVVRVIVPPLTAERREELVKRVGKLSEEARIAVRQIRGEVWEKVQRAHKDGEITDENREWGREEADSLTGEYNKKIEQQTKEKEEEIRTI